MDKSLIRARLEEILGEYPELDVLDTDVVDSLVENLVTEFTKTELEDLFDAEAEAAEDHDDVEP